MLAKLSALVSSKVAIAALGGVVVLGGAGTVVAAETGHLPDGVSIPLVTHHQNNDQTGDQNSSKNGDTEGHHAHTVAIQGTLTAANTHTISVTGKAEDQDDNNATKGTPSPTCSLKSPFTVALTGDTKINGQAKTAAELAKHIGSTVEVQATEDASCHLSASKVTVGGQDSTDPHSKVFVGTVGTVGSSSFTLQPAHDNPLTVNVSPTTKFDGVTGLSGLTHGMRVAAMGTQQSDSSVNASLVTADGPDAGHGADPGHRTQIGGEIASVNASSKSFVVTTEESQSITVHVSATTTYSGDATGLGDLTVGMRVAAAGTTQSDGSLNATHVVAQANGSQV